MGTLLTRLLRKAEDLVTNSGVQLTVESILSIDQMFLFVNGAVFNNTFFLLNAGKHQGKAYTQDESIRNLNIDTYMGRSLEDCLRDDNYFIRLLALDCAFSLKQKVPNKTYIVESDNAHDKLTQYMNIVRDNILVEENERVVVIGADATIPLALTDRTRNLRVTDLSERRIGKKYKTNDGAIITEIENGYEKSLEYVKQSDLAIVTGMTFSTNTVEEIIREARKSRTRLAFYMVTCANLAEELISQGASIVIAIGFPPIDIPGKTVVEIYKSNMDKNRT